MKTLIDVAVPAITFILLAAVGLDLTRADFARVRRRGSVVLLGLLAPLLLLPPIAVGLIWVFASPPEVAGGVSTTVPLAATFVVCSMAAGWITAAGVTADRRDRFTLAAEFGTRNVAVATAIAVTLLGRVEFARFATTYFLTELPLMLVAIAVFRWRLVSGSES